MPAGGELNIEELINSIKLVGSVAME